MKAPLVCAAAALLAAPSSAANEPSVVATGPGTEIYSGWPPDRYKAEFAAVVLFVKDTDPYCGPPPPAGFVRYGCSYTRADGTPIIVVLSPWYFQGDEYARILAHEGAHTLGWPGNHPL